MIHIKKIFKKKSIPSRGSFPFHELSPINEMGNAKEKVGAKIFQPLTTCPRFLPVSATEQPPPGPNSSLFMWELLFFLRKCHLSS